MNSDFIMPKIMNEELELLIGDIRCATFHMNDEEAIPVIDEYLVEYPELLKYHDKEWYYKNC
jgi:hypothetical protein